jgi:hypothetical protein
VAGSAASRQRHQGSMPAACRPTHRTQKKNRSATADIIASKTSGTPPHAMWRPPPLRFKTHITPTWRTSDIAFLFRAPIADSACVTESARLWIMGRVVERSGGDTGLAGRVASGLSVFDRLFFLDVAVNYNVGLALGSTLLAPAAAAVAGVRGLQPWCCYTAFSLRADPSSTQAAAR